ncbi:MAG: glycine cleavage system aminomethyltransferase GcvT [Candidatus Brocadiaceae bacterium]|nr:glycine cleavage system aminomethyltransferase GcvT [Candidatus Brocadiaceae bacterium]
MKKTPLFETHLAMNASMVAFSGYLMPIQYNSIIKEHNFVRKHAGLFDISHMGRFEISGNNACSFLQHVVANDVKRLADNKVLYTPICNEEGGIIDDILVYRRNEKHFLLVVNCANREKDLSWLQKQSNPYQTIVIRDVTDDISLVALQGPFSRHIIETTFNSDVGGMEKFSFQDISLGDFHTTISRTGYTGEDGFEIFTDTKDVVKLWNSFIDGEKTNDLLPAGLGARDTLRLEAGLLLYGNDMDETVTPLETPICWTVKFDKYAFVGKESLLRLKEKGIRRKLAGFEMIDRGIPRNGYPVLKGGEVIGKVTSGSFSPTTNKTIGLCLVSSQYAGIGEELGVRIRDKTCAARIVKIPFYTVSSKAV